MGSRGTALGVCGAVGGQERRGEERGTHLARAAAETGGKVVTSVVEEVDYRGEKYCRTTNGMMVSHAWRDVDDWIVGKIAHGRLSILIRSSIVPHDIYVSIKL